MEELRASKCVGQWQVPAGRIQAVDELHGPLAVHIVFTLDPVYLLEELAPALLALAEHFLLHAVAKLVVAGSAPQVVDCLEVSDTD